MRCPIKTEIAMKCSRKKIDVFGRVINTSEYILLYIIAYYLIENSKRAVVNDLVTVTLVRT